MISREIINIACSSKYASWEWGFSAFLSCGLLESSPHWSGSHSMQAWGCGENVISPCCFRSNKDWYIAAHLKTQLPPHLQFQLSCLEAGTSLGLPGDPQSTEHQDWIPSRTDYESWFIILPEPTQTSVSWVSRTVFMFFSSIFLILNTKLNA